MAIKYTLSAVFCIGILLLFSWYQSRENLSEKILSEDDIREIYANHIQVNYTDEYTNRYVPFPTQKNTLLSWPWEGKDLPRVVAILEFERYVKNHTITCRNGLAINGMDPEWHYLPAENITQIDYKSDRKLYDLHRINLPKKDFDFVMVNQTLEHVYDPLRCLKNIHTHMAPGGILYLNVPANNIPHSTPYHHYTGFTPVGLGCLIKAAGFTILSIGQWGNLTYLNTMFEKQNWPDYTYIKEPGKNDLLCPLIIWVFAEKKNKAKDACAKKW